jgi:hypothetical protein
MTKSGFEALMLRRTRSTMNRCEEKPDFSAATNAYGG